MEIITYRNKRNKHKFIELHNDGHRHNSIKQYMKFENGVVNATGDGNLHRVSKGILVEILEDYEKVE